MRKKVLITGSSGFVGRQLVKEIAKNPNYELYTMDKEPQNLSNEIIVDFCGDSFFSVVKDLPNVDVIIHLGAKVGWKDYSKSELFTSNVLATALLAQWAEKIGASFIFASTIVVCGMKNPKVGPSSLPCPDSDYGNSKWIAEEAVKLSGVKYCILRSAGIFGENGPRHLSLNKAIDDAIHGKIPFLYGPGSQKRNYIYVRDLVKDIIFCLDRELQGLYFTSGSYIDSLAGMLTDICEVFLPGKMLIQEEGESGMDQIVERSAQLPETRSFKSALYDIKKANI